MVTTTFVDQKTVIEAAWLNDIDNACYLLLDAATGTAAGARTALGLVIGTDVQAYDAQLDDIAALAVTSGNTIVADGTNWVASAALSNRSLIINGDFEVWQRGTSFTGVASAAYTTDRFRWGQAGSVVVDHLRSTDVPTVAESSHLSQYSLHVDVTTADASVAAADIAQVIHRIEGYDFAAIAQQAFTLSFWVKATKTGTYCVSFRSDGLDRSYVAEYTISSASTWEKKTITVSASPSAGTWDYSNGRGLDVSFTLMSGSTFQTTADAWNTGNFIATANQVNGVDSASNDFRLSQVKIELGSTATPFARAGSSFADEVSLCQRYYEKSYNLTVAPATSTSVGAIRFKLTGINSAAHNAHIPGSYAVRKRALPTLTYYAQDGTAGKMRDNANGTNVTATTGVAGERGFSVGGNMSSAGTTVDMYTHWTADAEL